MTNSHLAPVKAKDCYPNWEDSTEYEKEIVRNMLMDNNREVRKAYATFVNQLIQSFVERIVEPKIVQSIVLSYGVLDGSQDQSVKVFDFNKDDSTTDVFYNFI